MKRRTKYFRTGLSLLIITVFMAACKDDSAREFNDKLVRFKNGVDSTFISMNRYIDMALQEKEYSLINYLTDTAIDSIQIQTEQLQKLKTPDTGEEFRHSLTGYSQSLINTSQAYKSYILLSDSTITAGQIDSIQNRIKTVESRIDSAMQLVISAQKEFADRENLKLE